MTNRLAVIPNDRLCENHVHGSTRLTTNGIASFEIKHFDVRSFDKLRTALSAVEGLR